MGGCDKTVPAQLMGAAPRAQAGTSPLIGGPKMTRAYKEDRVGAFHRLP